MAQPETRSGENSYKCSSVKPCLKSVFQNRDSRYAKSYKRSLSISKENFPHDTCQIYINIHSKHFKRIYFKEQKTEEENLGDIFVSYLLTGRC